MEGPFLGSEALRAGRLTRHHLQHHHRPLHHDVYIGKDTAVTAVVRAKACWLRSRRRGVLAGFSAAALHGARWIDSNRPAEIVDANHRRSRGIRAWGSELRADEICTVEGMQVTTPARTALDLACRYPVAQSVPVLDSLARATELKASEVLELAARYPGRRGIRRARVALDLMDPGAQSPRETWLRLLLVNAGLPRPTTQILVHNGDFAALAYIDMGWEDIMVGLEYDGDQHRTDRRQYVKDIQRLEMLDRMGWLIVRVVAEDHPDDILRRVRQALARRQ